MNVMFMNSFNRVTEGGEFMSAQLTITEEHGVWQLSWTEEQAGRNEADIWYSGIAWNELLAIFRHGVAVKLGEGYRPMIDGLLHEAVDEHERMNRSQRLACYADLHPNDKAYSILNVWRKSKANQERKAPYFIATNRMLRMVSVFLPVTLDELLEIPGFGENKVELHGEEIIALTGDLERATNFPLDWVKDAVTKQDYKQWFIAQKELKYKQDMARMHTHRFILEGIQRGCCIAELAEGCSMSRRNMILMLENLARDGYELDALITVELQTVPMEEQAKIWEAIVRIGDRYLKPILLEVYGEDGLQGEQSTAHYERIRLQRIRYRKQQEKIGQAV